MSMPGWPFRPGMIRTPGEADMSMFYASRGVFGLRFGGLWRHPEFVKLWFGQTISQFGSQVSQLAIPLAAALVLNASPAEMGLLGAFEFAPFLVLSLFAGVW